MNRFEYDTTALTPGEEIVAKAFNTRLYDGDRKTSFEGGELTVTTYRLIWRRANTTPNESCISLPNNYLIYIEEENSSAFSFSSSNKLIFHLAPVVQEDKRRPWPQSSNNHVKISFKSGLENSFIHAVKEIMSLRKWENKSKAAVDENTKVKTRTGIIGIERGIQEKQKAMDHSISAAFQDLSKLMGKAKEMVELAKNISTKIREKQGSITEDETIQFKLYLMSLGIEDPVTRGGSSNETEYMNKLAREVSEILKEPIKEQGGMMSLADCYCRVNRARGMELISPEDMLRACNLLSKLGLPLALRQFDSGVRVLQLATNSDDVIVNDTTLLLKEKGSLTAEDLSQILGISVLLAKERLVTTENFGGACRDESIEGLRFYPNLFLERND